MPDPASLGEFEQLILLAVLRLNTGAHGMAIRRELSARTGRDVSIGAVYATLDRLEAKALLRSRIGEPTAVRGGRAKRLFEATPNALLALNRAHHEASRMREGMSFPLGAPEGTAS